MAYTLSGRSLDKLEGVNEDLVNVVKRAIELTKIDFGVIYGMRTLEEQKKLFDAGKSQTMKSKHLTGDAVDLMAYVDGKASWELNLYDDLADAMKWAATEEGVVIRWGAAWLIDDRSNWEGTMEDAMQTYKDLSRSSGRRACREDPN